ncbi:MAG: hypothetical protein ACI4RA_08910, partial [Kiritimatiellia bacterium]
MKRMCWTLAGLLACAVWAEDAWIQTDGTQYLDTGFRPSPKTKIVADYAFTAVTPTQQRVFGVQAPGRGLAFTHYINGGGNYAWAFQDNDGNWQNTGVPATTDRRRVTLDGPGNLFSLENWQGDGTWVKARGDMKITTTLSLRGLACVFGTIEV